VYFVTWRLASNQPPLTVFERDHVAETIRHFADSRYELFAYVVMDDHVHALVEPHRDHDLERLLHSWKSFSAHSIRRAAAPLWQREYFDRIVRDEQEFDALVQYIVQNPYNRWPGVTAYPWVWCRGDLLERL
jgi:REP element-mobilizing transposase RayT